MQKSTALILTRFKNYRFSYKASCWIFLSQCYSCLYVRAIELPAELTLLTREQHLQSICGPGATRRGPGQKVIAFALFSTRQVNKQNSGVF